MATLNLKNPHSVLAVLKTRPKDVLEIRVSQAREQRDLGDSTGKKDYWLEVLQLAKKLGIRTTTAPRPSKGLEPRGEEGRTSTTEAVVREKASVAIEQLLPPEAQGESASGLWLAFDQLQDPHNVGSIFRTAAFFGVRGIIMTQDRSATLTSTVYDVASGGVESVPFSIVPNLQRAFEVSKERGLWILGTSEHAKQPWNQVSKDRNWLLVFGNEEKGMRRLTEESCDVVCSIPPASDAVTSLNVSVTAGILISKLA
ncbi:23S rRNA (guanosine(2251)-2'-O)-methyltransferase RlmB [bacterium]|nr:23S rRNA (guanosine(2251)-2'-O)-methyltransferase RlmB [bacterium]